MGKKIGFLFLLFIIVISVYSQPPKPKLIIGIVVEQMRYDFLERYWEKYDLNGFKAIINGGLYYRNATHNYMFAQTGSGHASISTGTTPSQHGIVSTYWYDTKKKEYIYCAADKNTHTVGSSSKEGNMSPINLLSTTIGDELLLASMQRSKVISVALTDCASIFMGGHTANAAYWFDKQSGNMISSSHYLERLPSWVEDFNYSRYADFYLTKDWNTAISINEYWESMPDNNVYEKGFDGGRKIFPYKLEEIHKETPGYDFFTQTPFANTLIAKFAMEAIKNEQLGKDAITDYLTISFSATQNLGTDFGPRSIEMEDMYIRLDMDIYNLLDFIDKEVGIENTLIYLTSDHGTNDYPNYLKDNGLPAGTFNYKTAFSLLKVYLSALYGREEWVLAYVNQQFYLDRDLLEDKKMSLNPIQADAARLLLQFTGVSNVVPASDLKTQTFANQYVQSMQNSYYEKRSGDVIINLENGWVEDGENAISYNSPYSYDTHVPLIWYGWKIKPANCYRKINISDIAPTISAILSIPFPSACTGTPLEEVIK